MAYQPSCVIKCQSHLTQSAGAVEYINCTSANPLPNECLGYDTKQSDGEGPVILKLWGMRSTPSLPLPLGPPWLGVVAPDRVLSMGQIEVTAYLC